MAWKFCTAPQCAHTLAPIHRPKRWQKLLCLMLCYERMKRLQCLECWKFYQVLLAHTKHSTWILWKIFDRVINRYTMLTQWKTHPSWGSKWTIMIQIEERVACKKWTHQEAKYFRMVCVSLSSWNTPRECESGAENELFGRGHFIGMRISEFHELVIPNQSTFKCGFITWEYCSK